MIINDEMRPYFNALIKDVSICKHCGESIDKGLHEFFYTCENPKLKDIEVRCPMCIWKE